MKDLTWIKESFISHRGLHTEDKKIPENSMTAFQKAIENGYAIELDINVLKDGTVVVFHDKDFNRLCNINQYLKDLNIEDIKDFRLLKTDLSIPTLKEVLDLVKGQVPLMIELKPFGDHTLLCTSFMEVIKDYKGVYAVQSFHPKTVLWFKVNQPNIVRGQISEFFRDDPKMKKITKLLLKTMFLNIFTKPDFINYGIHEMPNKYVNKALKKGLTVIGYCSRNQETFDYAKQYIHNSVFEFFIPNKKAKS